MTSLRKPFAWTFGTAIVSLAATLSWPLLAQEPAAATATPGPLKATAMERWRTLHAGGERIGYEQATVTTRDEGGKTIVVSENRMVLEPRVPASVNRVRATVLIRTEETEDGQLLAFTYEQVLPRPLVSTRKVGRLQDGKLSVETTKGSRTVTKVVDWPAGIVGPGYADRWILQTALKAGETRTVTTFDPRTGQPDTVTIVAGQVEPVLLADGTERPLLHAVSTHSIAPGIEFHEFLDDAGNLVKTTVPAQDLVLHTVPEDAIQKAFPAAAQP